MKKEFTYSEINEITTKIFNLYVRAYKQNKIDFKDFLLAENIYIKLLREFQEYEENEVD